jgi:predicted protein tyrosine phosphatase
MCTNVVDVVIPELIITSLAEAPRVLLSETHGPRIACIISIGDPGEQVPAGYARVERRLRLELSDIVDDDEAGVRPAREHVERILEFVDVITGAPGATLIHCQAGISRSTAAAFTVVSRVLGPGREIEALDLVLRLRPIAFPNLRIVQLADELLERQGAMSRALVARGVALIK